ncbi:hypothetical protein DTQ13_01420 [Parasaccharibacter sp. TMW 2.1888]|nr:hypothetical protein [Parasaccharibacter sp. TMW 2.1891]UPO79211.1 hypothetical protein DTQ13_01420 [Parasaccharibacter sp. TMW 2.1888]
MMHVCHGRIPLHSQHDHPADFPDEARMTDLYSASSTFPPFPRPFITISTRPALLKAHQHFATRPFTILSPLHAGASLGVDWWLHLTRGAEAPSILDCGASASLAISALHEGIDGVVCRDFRAGLPDDMKHRLFSSRPEGDVMLDLPLFQETKCWSTSQQSVTSDPHESL